MDEHAFPPTGVSVAWFGRTLQLEFSDLLAEISDDRVSKFASFVERTGAGVEWLTPVPEVLGSILSQGAFRCGLEQVTFPQLLR